MGKDKRVVDAGLVTWPAEDKTLNDKAQRIHQLLSAVPPKANRHCPEFWGLAVVAAGFPRPANEINLWLSQVGKLAYLLSTVTGDQATKEICRAMSALMDKPLETASAKAVIRKILPKEHFTEGWRLVLFVSSKLGGRLQVVKKKEASRYSARGQKDLDYSGLAVPRVGSIVGVRHRQRRVKF